MIKSSILKSFNQNLKEAFNIDGLFQSDRVIYSFYSMGVLQFSQNKILQFTIISLGIYENKQVCYMQGNPVFSVIHPPPSISSNAKVNESEGNLLKYKVLLKLVVLY